MFIINKIIFLTFLSKYMTLSQGIKQSKKTVQESTMREQIYCTSCKVIYNQQVQVFDSMFSIHINKKKNTL